MAHPILIQPFPKKFIRFFLFSYFFFLFPLFSSILDSPSGMPSFSLTPDLSLSLSLSLYDLTYFTLLRPAVTSTCRRSSFPTTRRLLLPRSVVIDRHHPSKNWTWSCDGFAYFLATSSHIFSHHWHFWIPREILSKPVRNLPHESC